MGEGDSGENGVPPQVKENQCWRQWAGLGVGSQAYESLEGHKIEVSFYFLLI